jgi:hypothetical protein
MPNKDVKVRLKADYVADSLPDVVYVSKKNQEGVTWYCEGGEASIEFEKESPFVSSVFIAPEGGSVSSGPVESGEPGKSYKYRIIGRMRGDRRHYFGDPHVQVEP